MSLMSSPLLAQQPFIWEVGGKEYYAYSENGKWGLKYNDCTYVHPQYDDATLHSPYGEPLSVVCLKGRWFVVNGENRPLFTRTFEDIKTQAKVYPRKVLKPEYRETNTFGWYRMTFSKDEYIEIVDSCLHGTAQNIPIDDYFSKNFEFEKRTGWHPILMGAKEHGKWGYVDALGEWVIAPIYDEVGTTVYNHKSARLVRFLEVKKDGKWLIIDIFGTPVYESEERPKIDVWGIRIKSKIDTRVLKRERAEYARKYDDILRASIIADSLASRRLPQNPNVVPVEDEYGYWGLRDTSSNQWIATCKYDRMFDIEDGKGAYRVVCNGKYGVVNVISGEVIPCIFDSISPFDENGNAVSFKGHFRGKVNVYGYNGMEKDLMLAGKLNDLLEINVNNYFALRFLARLAKNPAVAEKYFYAAREVCRSRYDDYMVQNVYGGIAYELASIRNYQKDQRVSDKITSALAILSGTVDATNQLYMSYLDMRHVGAPDSKSGDVSSTSSGNYQSQYAMWERRAKANYESLTNLGYGVTQSDGSESGSAMGGMNTGNYAQMKKALREAQNEMTRIRRKASENGISIPQSKWETATVRY